MRPLPAAAATRVDASSTSDVSVYSSVQLLSDTDPPEARKVNFLARPSMRISHHWIQQCTVDDAMQVYSALREVGAGTGGALAHLLP